MRTEELITFVKNIKALRLHESCMKFVWRFPQRNYDSIEVALCGSKTLRSKPTNPWTICWREYIDANLLCQISQKKKHFTWNSFSVILIAFDLYIKYIYINRMLICLAKASFFCSEIEVKINTSSVNGSGEDEIGINF